MTEMPDPTAALPAVIDVLLVEDDPGDVLMTREAFEEHKLRNNLHVVTDGVEVGETQHQVRVALLKLTPEQREVVMLRHFGAMSYAEMAASLGIPVKTVKSRLFSGRQRLCDLLAAAKG